MNIVSKTLGRISAGITIFILIICVSNIASATPYIPQTDNEVLEQLPNTMADSRARELRTLRQALSATPENLILAVQLAHDYIEIGRETGDPRYAGYAQSALSPWWEKRDPPDEVLILRAQLRQRTHQFQLALADLDRALLLDSRAGAARLLRATIRQVMGDYAGATSDCTALRGLVHPPVVAHCVATIQSVTGKLAQGYAHLKEASQSMIGIDVPTRAWILTSMGEMAARLGQPAQAAQHFKDALLLTPSDQYLLIAYSDFLLDNQRAAEVIPLLAPYSRADGLLLRYALALAATGGAARDQIEQLRARYAAGSARGETAHQREEARFALELDQAPARALALAKANWQVQKEPSDLNLLRDCAQAVGDQSALQIAQDWIAGHHYEDYRITPSERSANPPRSAWLGFLRQPNLQRP
jgi:hypothetical protein